MVVFVYHYFIGISCLQNEFQILNLAHNKSDIERRVHAVIDKFAERGLRSLAVAYQVTGFLLFSFIVLWKLHKMVIIVLLLCYIYFFTTNTPYIGILHPFIHLMQEVPEGRKESAGGPWQFIGLMPLFDPPRHDSAETIRRALNLGVNVKMITGMFYWQLKTSMLLAW